MKKLLLNLKNHLPGYLAVAVVVIDALEQSGTITISTKMMVIINTILGAFGIGVLHVRQFVASKATMPVTVVTPTVETPTAPVA